MKSKHPRLCALLAALALSLGAFAIFAHLPVTVAADGNTVYLGDREDLFVERDSLDGLGMNQAHSGEALTVGSARFETGVGFHCQPDRDAYVEFDISSLGMTYFAASVGVLKEANYFMEWGSISFHVYGDGVLLASSPVMLWGDEPYFLTCSVEGVSKLRLVQNNEGGHSCDAGIWGDARVTNEKPVEPDAPETEFDPNHTSDPHPEEAIMGDYTYISDLYWTDTVTYPGNVPGRDSNTCNEMIFSADGTYFPKGVGLHATSSDYTAFVEVNLDGLGYTKFAAFYGVCETLSAHDISMAEVKLALFGDGQKLWESDTMTFGKPMERMECDITGVKTLRLAVAGAPGIAGAWATWGGAVISKSGEITDDMLFEDMDFDVTTESETKPETQPETQPETKEPETTPVTEPDTLPPETTATTLPESAPTTEAETTAETPADTVAPDTSEAATAADTTADTGTDTTAASEGGCASSVALGVTVGGAVAAAVALCKRKED